MTLGSALGSISSERIREMQAALAELGKGFQYSLSDDDDDAVALLLRGLRASAAARGCLPPTPRIE